MTVENQIFTAFQLGDENGNGFLSREDLKVAMLFLFGYKPSKYEIDQLMRCEKHSELNDVMSFGTFSKIMTEKLQIESEDQRTREFFLMLDVKCKGFLTIDDLQHAFKQCAPAISHSTVLSCFKEMCHHADGKLSYREFEQVIKSQVSR